MRKQYGEAPAPENESRANKFLRYPAAPVILMAAVGGVVLALIKLFGA